MLFSKQSTLSADQQLAASLFCFLSGSEMVLELFGGERYRITIVTLG